MIERHPFEPFLPENAKVLFLGSFPPQSKRWSIDFYYPNFINDFWRICGLIFFNDKEHFIVPGSKRFDKELIISFCEQKGIALYDTATAIRRLNDNASDKFLEVVEPTDIPALLKQIPHCTNLVTTGQKATDVIVETYGALVPEMASFSSIELNGRQMRFWRMPSSSRAYPLSLERKAAAYRLLFESTIL